MGGRVENAICRVAIFASSGMVNTLFILLGIRLTGWYSDLAFGMLDDGRLLDEAGDSSGTLVWLSLNFVVIDGTDDFTWSVDFVTIGIDEAG